MNTDLISRQAVIDSLYDWSNHSMTDAETWHLKQIIGDIRSMPSVNLQPCEDAISREAVISIIEESKEDDADEWMGYPWKVTPNLLMDEVRKLPPIIPKQTEITLESAIDYLNSIGWMQEHDRILTESAQSVTPIQRTGYWIAQDIHNCHTDFKCSECGYIHSFMHLYGKPTADYTYCPNCGCRMVEPQERSK